jgi:hypothetical protein
MDPNSLAAIISATSSAAVAITALILNQRGFAAIDSRFASLESRIASMEARFDRRFEAIEADLKEFFKVQAEHDKGIQRLEDQK